MPELQVENGTIFYEVRGEGPPLVLLHAGVADSRMWEPQVEAFAAHFRVVTCDMRGFGHSPLPDGPFAHHDDVVALLDHLSLDRAWLIGASFGGRVALDLCLGYPERVGGLVLAAPAVGGFQHSGEVVAFGEREDELLEAGKLEEAARLNVEMWVVGPHRAADAVDPAVRERVAEMQLEAFRQPEPENVSVRAIEPPAIERLHEIEVPLLVLSGKLDVAAFVELAHLIVERVPDSQHVSFPNAAHMLSMEEPKRFNQLVLDFILSHEKEGHDGPARSDG